MFDWIREHVEWTVAALFTAIGTLLGFIKGWWDLHRKVGELSKDYADLEEDFERYRTKLDTWEGKFLTISGELRIASAQREAELKHAQEEREHIYKALDDLADRFEKNTQELRALVIQALNNHRTESGK